MPETHVKALGYRAMAAHRLDDAIALFILNTELYPGSWNAYDRLGEACLAAGSTDLAIVNYRHSLALNPRNGRRASAAKARRGTLSALGSQVSRWHRLGLGRTPPSGSRFASARRNNERLRCDRDG